MADASPDRSSRDSVFVDPDADLVSEYSTAQRLRDVLEAYVTTPFRIVVADRRTRIGLFILSLYVLMATVGVWFLPEPTTGRGPRLMQPFQSWEYPLGTDPLTQGLFRAVVHATPTMLKILFAGAVFATVLATVVGTVAGYREGLVDEVFTLITDVVITIPGLPLLIVVIVVLEPENPYLVGVILSIDMWPGLARTIRSEVLSLRDTGYVEASRLMGIPMHAVILKDVLPNLMPYILINFMRSGRRVIFTSVGLYFLGFLPPSSKYNWGVMLDSAFKGAALTSWEMIHWLLVPMLAITVLSYGLVMFAQGMDRVFNPRVRARHAKSDADLGGEFER